MKMSGNDSMIESFQNSSSGGQRVAMVFAHPAHELFASGIIQRVQPHILYITRADGAGCDGREEMARVALKEFGFHGTVTFLGVSEKEVHRRILTADLTYFLQLRDRVSDWLSDIGPDVILTDAFEWYNSLHDLCPLLVDSALQSLQLGSGACAARYELSLAIHSLAEPPLPSSESDGATAAPLCHSLSPHEATIKQSVMQVLGRQDDSLGSIVNGWDLKRCQQEFYQRVPADRDYRTAPKCGDWQTYDQHGKQRVKQGRYSQAILFKDHFVPLAEALLVADPPLSSTTVTKVA